jgi:hypothetical protein
VGPRAGLDAVEKRKISCPCQESNTGPLARSPSLYRLRYADSYYKAVNNNNNNNNNILLLLPPLLPLLLLLLILLLIIIQILLICVPTQPKGQLQIEHE